MILVILLFLSNAGWLGGYIFRTIEHGITLAYQTSSYDSITKMLEQALVVANKNLIGTSLSVAQVAIEKDVFGSEPFLKEGCFYAGDLCLEIGQNSQMLEVRAE